MSNKTNTDNNELALTPDNYVGEVQDIQARQAIELMGNTIHSLFYGEHISNQIKQEVALRQKESEKNILAVVDDKIDSKIEERGLTQQESGNLDKARKSKVISFLGASKIKGIPNPKNILFSGYMFGVIKAKVKNEFHIKDYTDITPKQYLDVLNYIKNDIILTNEMIVCAKRGLDEEYRNDVCGLGCMNSKIKKIYENVFIYKTMTLKYPFVKESNSDNIFVDNSDINNI